MFIPKYLVMRLIANLNSELQQDIYLKGIFKGYCLGKDFIRNVVLALDSEKAMELYPKIKNSKPMEEFEKTHNAICVLDKCKGKWVIKINF